VTDAAVDAADLRDPRDPRLAVGATGMLAAFNRASVLTAADVHAAQRIGALVDETDEQVLLAAALAVRAPRLGHVCTDLRGARHTVATDVETPGAVEGLGWPEPDRWLERVSGSALVADGTAQERRPLRLSGSLLYLDRYWQEEQRVGADLMLRAEAAIDHLDEVALDDSLERLFDGGRADLQRQAAETAARRRLTVVAGGPGTGKTTTVARILALLHEHAAAAGTPPPRVGLAAPTGKAAARLQEAVHAEAARLPVHGDLRERLAGLQASTLHRLLGWRPGSRGRFRHHRGNRLPHDVVVVDETSMVSLSLMASLVEAVRADARLVLVGDPQQLASVEAGAVLGDIVGPDDRSGTLTQSVVVLRRVHRFGEAIEALAEAIRGGDADEAINLLRAGDAEVRWLPVDAAAGPGSEELGPVRAAVVEAGREVVAAAARGDGRGALDGLGTIRVLCAHRRGPYGAATWARHVERWLAAALPGYAEAEAWYVGRPVLVTANDYGLRLFNGDTGVVVDSGDGQLAVVFERQHELVELSPVRLSSVDTVHAMTIHKSQGSQLDEAVVLLPEASSPILTRELLYTAVTRARNRVTVVGTEQALRAAITRPIARASGLRSALWR
jgi:exodeoxyribonuclease V alpha subunit